MPELDEIKKEMEQIAIECGAAKRNLLRTLGLPVEAQLDVERLHTGSTKLVIEIPCS
jgi:hypothetical protein